MRTNPALEVVAVHHAATEANVHRQHIVHCRQKETPPDRYDIGGTAGGARCGVDGRAFVHDLSLVIAADNAA